MRPKIGFPIIGFDAQVEFNDRVMYNFFYNFNTGRDREASAELLESLRGERERFRGDLARLHDYRTRGFTCETIGEWSASHGSERHGRGE